MKNITYHLCILLCGILFLFIEGCADDSFCNNVSKVQNTELVLQIQAPHLRYTGATRAMTEDDEKAVKSLKVLVFEEADSGSLQYNDLDEKFAYAAAVLEQNVNIPEEGITSVRVKLTVDLNKKKRLVLIANHPGPFPMDMESYKGRKKSEVFALLKAGYENNWDATDGISTIPMWGESNLVRINGESVKFTDFNASSSDVSSPIKLLRSLARVDVGIAFNNDPQSETTQPGMLVPFKLKSVSVYRTGTSFSVPSTQKSYLENIPFIPATMQYRTDDIPLRYVLDKAGDSYVREIYIPERMAGNDNNNAPCLIIGGFYKDSQKITYYRADFMEKDAISNTAKYLDILRNYRYRFNISKVSGPGFDTEEEALKSKPENFQYTVIVWNESSVTDVMTDGQYMLGVNKNHLVFSKSKGEKEIVVRTDWPEGWKAIVTDGAPWLTINPTEGEAGSDNNLFASVLDNETEQDREGKIMITAGRMKWEVRVTQLAVSEVSVELFEEDGATPLSMLQFSGQGGEKKVVVRYEPAEGNLVGPENLSGDDFVWEKIEQESTAGKSVYKVTAQKMVNEQEDFESLNNTVSFSITNEGKKALKALVLLQTEYNAIPFADSRLNNPLVEDNGEFYVMDGIEKDFFIKANTRYTIELIENDPEPGVGIGKLIPNGLKINKLGKITGEQIVFRPADDLTELTRFMGYAGFKISSPDRLFEDKYFSILLTSGKKQPEANCYLMKPGKIGILIPVSRINTAKEFYDQNKTQLRDGYAKYKLQESDWSNRIELPKLEHDDDWNVEILWADVPANYSGKVVRADGTGVIKVLKKAGTGEKGYIFVYPGNNINNCGNIVIALRSGKTREIMWSWHLWIVHEYPFDGSTYSGKKWLNRDLGALLPNLSSPYKPIHGIGLHGMLYQWGRKDPFRIEVNSLDRKLIDADGGAFVYKGGAAYESLTMKETIQRPDYMVYNAGNWLYESGDSNEGEDVWFNIWGGKIINSDRSNNAIPTQKTVFDPSPYGWKIPSCGLESNWNGYGPYLTKGCYYYPRGDITKCIYTNFETFRFTSSVYRTDQAAGYVCGSQGNDTNNRSWNRTRGMSIRSVEDQSVADYRKYLP